MKMPRLSTDQMMGGGMSDMAFATWFVDEIMKDDLPNYFTDLGPQTCVEFTITARRYAAHFGITRPDLQGQFAYLAWTVGPNFWTFAAFGRVLAAKWPTEEDKIDALFNVPEDDAAAAILGADDRYWVPSMTVNNPLGTRDGDEHDG
jgi:hypothetical protein